MLGNPFIHGSGGGDRHQMICQAIRIVDDGDRPGRLQPTICPQHPDQRSFSPHDPTGTTDYWHCYMSISP
ncbi:MAG: hypothetical protein VKK04_14110 [Synechococcales bacterium]|nr:hypothetical protein [Synechococcales bacterium]